MTQALWEAVMGNNPSFFRSDTRPVEQVSFIDARQFLTQINDLIPGLDLILPSEAQWEYACRAGTRTATYAGPMTILGDRNAPVLDKIAWYAGNSGVDFDLPNHGFDSKDWKGKQYNHTKAGTRPVKQKEPNAFGLYDMLGNVWEWCEDAWHGDYNGAPTDGSAWSGSEAADRVMRGGSWSSEARYVRAASRNQHDPSWRHNFVGFRCARGGAGQAT